MKKLEKLVMIINHHRKRAVAIRNDSNRIEMAGRICAYDHILNTIDMLDTFSDSEALWYDLIYPEEEEDEEVSNKTEG